MDDEVGHCFVCGWLGGLLVHGLSEYSNSSEGFDELLHVCGIRDWIISNFSKRKVCSELPRFFAYFSWSTGPSPTWYLHLTRARELMYELHMS